MRSQLAIRASAARLPGRRSCIQQTTKHPKTGWLSFAVRTSLKGLLERGGRVQNVAHGCGWVVERGSDEARAESRPVTGHRSSGLSPPLCGRLCVTAGGGTAPRELVILCSESSKVADQLPGERRLRTEQGHELWARSGDLEGHPSLPLFVYPLTHPPNDPSIIHLSTHPPTHLRSLINSKHMRERTQVHCLKRVLREPQI